MSIVCPNLKDSNNALKWWGKFPKRDVDLEYEKLGHVMVIVYVYAVFLIFKE